MQLDLEIVLEKLFPEERKRDEEICFAKRSRR